MNDPTIISLTAIPSRFPDLGPTLRSLLTQDLPVAEVRLNIPQYYRRFPEWDGQLPEVPEGVRIVRCAEDYGPASKVLPTVLDYRGQAVDILFCDDDKIYDSGWHRRFKTERKGHPGAAIVEVGENFPDISDNSRAVGRLPRACRRHRDWRYRLYRALTLTLVKPHPFTTSGYVDMLSGYAGVMVRPEFFDDETYDIPAILWTVDDPWLSGHLERMEVPIWLNHRGRIPSGGNATSLDALEDLVEGGHGRTEADLAAIRYMRETYGIWVPQGQPIPPQGWMRPSMRALAWAAIRSGGGKLHENKD